MKKLFALIVLFAGAAQLASGYVLEGQTWNRSVVFIMMNLNPTRYKLTKFRGFPLSDGTRNWNIPFQYACYDWDQYISAVQLVPLWGKNYGAGGTFGDRINQTHFGASIGGSNLDSDTLAITDYYYDNNNFFLEADIVFNQNIRWNSYRGPLWPTSTDIYRVALHELGHVLGLAHPDDAGQNVNAVMNSHVSNTDDLTFDDVTGAQALYGARTAEP